MAFEVEGRIGSRGGKRIRYRSHAATEELARAEATARHIEIIRVAPAQTPAKLRAAYTAENAAPAWMTIALIAAIVVPFLLRTIIDSGFWEAAPDLLVRWGASYPPLTFGPEPWRLLTAPFAQQGLPEAVVCVGAIGVAGTIAERNLGRLFLLSAFVLGGVGACIAEAAWNALDVASDALGAVFGVGAATIAMTAFFGRRADPAVAGAAFTAMGATTLVVVFLLASEFGRNVAWASIGGGLLAGGAFGLLAPTRKAAQPLLRATIAVVFVAALLAAAGIGERRRVHAVTRTASMLDAVDALTHRVDAQIAELRRDWEVCHLDEAALTARVRKEILPDWRNVRGLLDELAPFPEPLTGDALAKSTAMRQREATFEAPAQRLHFPKPDCAQDSTAPEKVR